MNNVASRYLNSDVLLLCTDTFVHSASSSQGTLAALAFSFREYTLTLLGVVVVITHPHATKYLSTKG